MSPPRHLTIADLCARYQWSRRTLARHRRHPQFPRPIADAGHPRWRLVDIERYESGLRLTPGRRPSFVSHRLVS